MYWVERMIPHILKNYNMKLETIYKKTKTGATQEWTIEVVGKNELKNKDIFLSLMRGIIDSEYDKKK